MVDLRDWSVIQTKVIELQQTILQAQSSLFAAHEERTALVETVSQLKKEMTEREAWETEKQRYQLQKVYVGSFAYVVKEEARGTEPIHWLCARCYEEGKKSLLQATRGILTRGGGMEVVHECPRCKSSIRAQPGSDP
jgi:hypothetical protein